MLSYFKVQLYAICGVQIQVIAFAFFQKWIRYSKSYGPTEGNSRDMCSTLTKIIYFCRFKNLMKADLFIFLNNGTAE